MESLFDVVVIGGGPAGASAAVWLKMLGFRPLVVEARSQLGGLQTINPYANEWIVTSPFATGSTVADAIRRSVVDEHGIATWLDSRVLSITGTDGAFVTRVQSGAQGREAVSKKVVLASGVRASAGGLHAAARILIGPGSNVAATDFAGLKVAILGGGDNAAENYEYVKAHGAAVVHLYARTLHARAELLGRLDPADVHLGDYRVDEKARRVNGSQYDLLLVLYGWAPNIEYAAGLGIAMDTHGHVVTDPRTGEATVRGVFAAGELAGRMHPCCVTAMADGVVVATAIQQQLERALVTRMVATLHRLAGAAATAAPWSPRGHPAD